MISLDSQETKDVTKNTKFNKDNNVATLSLSETEIGKYRLVITVDNTYTLSTIITVTDKLKVKSVAYTVSTSRKFPTDLERTVVHPNKIDNMKTATDDHYIHMAVSAGFIKSSHKPQQVYFSLKQNSPGKNNIAINTYGKLSSSTGLYQLTFDVSHNMEHINGEYNMEIHVADYRAEKSAVWQLGSIHIWLKEGIDEATNEGIREEYLTKPIIEHYFSPSAPEKSFIVNYNQF